MRTLQRETALARAPRARNAGPAAARPLAHRLQGTLGNAAMAALFAPGEPLRPEIRAEMEARFGQDFGDVRVHVGGEAAESAAAMGAEAYTVGRDVVFSAGRYDPRSEAGAHLLAHELAHVVQQSRGDAAPAVIEAALEAGAEQAATATMRGDRPVQVSGASGVGVARQLSSLVDREKRLYPHTVTFKSMDEYAASDAAAPPISVNADGTVTATVLRPYPQSALAAPKPAAPAPKSAPKPAAKPKSEPEPPTDIHLLMDYLEATRPRVIYPKPVRHFFGGLQFLGGSLETLGGGVAGIETAETGAGLLAGGLVFAHGLDVASSGWHTMWTGEESQTYTYMMGAGWAIAAGADPKMASAVGHSTDLLANIGSAGLSLKVAAAPFTIAEETPYRVLFYHGFQSRWPGRLNSRNTFRSKGILRAHRRRRRKCRWRAAR